MVGMTHAEPITLPVQGPGLYAGLMGESGAPGEDDAALVRRIREAAPGTDSAAEAEVCRRFALRARLFALRHLRNEAAAADLAQDVLIIVLRQLRAGGVRDADRLAAFVLGTARQCIVDWRRGVLRRERLLEAFPADLPSLVHEDAEPLDADRLRTCLQGLPERERAVLLMTFYDDRPADAVGAELGLSAANVRVIRHRGIGRLRACMGAGRAQ